MHKRWWLYILKLEHDKWYVGITSKTPDERYREHKNNIRAAAWTRAHRPIKLYDSQNLGEISVEMAKSKETNTTLTYMRKYGVNNVRGGDLVAIEEYKVIFGRIMSKEMWPAFKVIVLLLVLQLISNLILIGMYYSKV